MVAAADADQGMRAYIIVSLLTGARTEELRALTWAHVELDGDLHTVSLWRSVRATGDTKTRHSRRTVELPARATEALRAHREAQLVAREAAGNRWHDIDLVFSTSVGTPLDAANVRRAFRRVAAKAGLDAQGWTPRELRDSFVSLLSSTGMSIEDISHLVGHASSRVTELVYRKELRPVLTRGARAMDALFPANEPEGR
jgi:integrase